jgi:deazaflavin-dependent oxidoreductase (nitroreductase family)
MNEQIRTELSRGHTIDITTRGARSGQPRRIEIVFHVIGGRIYISGMPSRRTRAWIHNLQADPNLTFHLKGPGPSADLPATARIITDETERRPLIEQIARIWRRIDVDTMVEFSPLIEVTIAGYAADAAA